MATGSRRLLLMGQVMGLADINSQESFKTDAELMTVLHESLVWQCLADRSPYVPTYTNLRGALEDLFEAHKKGKSIAFLSNIERGVCIGVDQIKSLWKRIGLV